MDKFDRVQKIHRILLSHKRPVPIRKFEAQIECSRKSVRSAIDALRYYVQAPLEYDSHAKGWYYNLSPGEKFELPGLWLTAREMQSLVALLHILQQMDDCLLGKEIKVIEKEIEKLLGKRGIDPKAFLQKIKFLPMAKRAMESNQFSLVCEALLHERQIFIRYQGGSGKKSQRDISPLTLAYYRENWYLDAWCHLRNELRTFSLSRIRCLRLIDKAVKVVSEKEREAHFESSYGIFAGKAKNTAKLKFYPEIARHIASQQWHPEQVGEWQEECYLLSIPYGDDRELILDILKHGNNVEVLAPAKLKNAVIGRLRGALSLYASKSFPEIEPA